MGFAGPLETGVIYCEDNLGPLAAFPDASVDLIYLDPPFFSNRQYEVIWGDEAEIRSFDDRWKGGIDYYVDWMRERIVHLHRALKPTGSLFLHCDPTASHYLKVMLDREFGRGNFRNEIVWQRAGIKGDARRKLGANHDLILSYGKTSDAYFQVPRREPDAAYLARFDMDDLDGRGPYHSAPLDSPNERPNLTYVYRGYPPPAKGWRVDRAEMERLDREGRLIFPRNRDGRIRRKLYLRDAPGPPLGDVWTDIPAVGGTSEQIGYPTQKPMALLERIITSASQPGAIILDPFCGCGTSIAVAAEQLRRRWIGIDISPTAVNLMVRRMLKLSAKVRTHNMPETLSDLRALKHFEFQNWVIQRVHGRHNRRKTGDLGIDGYSFLEGLPIQVKQMDSVDRTEVDKFETAVRRDKKHKGYIIAFSFTKGAYNEAARAKREGLEIALVEISTLLDGPDVEPPPGTSQLVADLLEGVRAATLETKGAPPHRPITVLAASVKGELDPT